VGPVQEFTYTSAAARVIFGAGSLQHLEREVELLGAQRALVLCTPEQTAIAQQVAERLGARAVGVFAGAAMHVPIETARAVAFLVSLLLLVPVVVLVDIELAHHLQLHLAVQL
jgi:alcohol dehydrogenase class IV